VSPGRLPSASISILRPSEAASRSLLRSRGAPRTRSPDSAVPPVVAGELSLRGYPTSSRFASRLSSTLRTRCFSPTSATDLRHEHPWNARFPGARLTPHRPPSSSPTEVGFSRAAPDRLATIRPRLRVRLTAHRSSFGPSTHDETRAASSRRSPRRGPTVRSRATRAFSVRMELANGL